MAGNAYKRDGNLSGISTRFTALDNKMGGLQSSDLIVLAGRPSMGKTALATNIAFNVARLTLTLPCAGGAASLIAGNGPDVQSGRMAVKTPTRTSRPGAALS